MSDLGRYAHTTLWVARVICLLIGGVARAAGQQAHDLAHPRSVPETSVVVVGYLGGFERWDDPHRGVRRLAQRLNTIPGVRAETVSNHRRKPALQWLKRCLDANQDGHLSLDERNEARIILYGQSLGGAAAVDTARDLDALGVPVLLTVQVDSVGLHDNVIPPNVRQAVNLFQNGRLTLRGQSRILASDPARTRTVTNIGYSYPWPPSQLRESTWIRRVFGGGHARMEADPLIWKQVEQYISHTILGR